MHPWCDNKNRDYSTHRGPWPHVTGPLSPSPVRTECPFSCTQPRREGQSAREPRFRRETLGSAVFLNSLAYGSGTPVQFTARGRGGRMVGRDARPCTARYRGARQFDSKLSGFPVAETSPSNTEVRMGSERLDRRFMTN